MAKPQPLPSRPAPRRPRTAGSKRARPKSAKASPRALALTAVLDELEARADDLAERMLEQYLASIPSYRSLPDETIRQVRDVNRRNLHGFIRAMRRGRGPSPDEFSFIQDSASRRAREGVPLSALLAAYRLGAQLAWHEAMSLLGGDTPRLEAGLDLATAVMRWVDEVSGAVATAYLEEFERLSSDREAARRDFLDGAIGGGLTADEVTARAEALGLDPNIPYAVAILATSGEADDESTVRAAQHRVRSLLVDAPIAEPGLVVTRGPEVVVIFPADASGEEPVIAGLRAIVDEVTDGQTVGLRCGVGRGRDSLSELAGSYREASIALAAARAGSRCVAVYGEVLVEELILRERGVARRLASTILDPLAFHPDLRDTLVEYLQHGPSLPAVAKRLFLHPNTVAYRLARVRELTGRDPKTPAGVAELFLALRAAQLVGDDPI